MQFRIRQKIKKRLIAVFLTMALVLGHISVYSNTVLAENLEQVEFEIEGYDLVRAVREAIREDSEIANGGLQLTDGETKKFYDLFQGEGRLLEIEPELERPDFMVDLRIFVRVPEDADDSYSMTGDEELLFLFVNYMDEDAACLVSVSRVETGELLYEETKPVQIKDYEEWARGEEAREEEGLADETLDDEGSTAGVKRASIATPSVTDYPAATPSVAAAADRQSSLATPSIAVPSVATPSTATASNGDRKDSAASALIKLVVGIDGCGTARVAVSSINELKAWQDTRMEGIPYEYEDDKIAVKVMLPMETAVPVNAEMRVAEITEDGGEEQYEALLEKAKTKLNSDIPELQLFDLSFYTLDGDYIEVSDDARVSIRFKTDLLEQNGNIGILHFAAGGPKLVRLLAAEWDEEDQLTAVTFDTDGFSTIGVVNGMAPATGSTGADGYTLLGLVLMLGAVFCFGRRYGVLFADLSNNHDGWNKKIRRK